MAVSFPRPSFEFDYDPIQEAEKLRHYRDHKDGRQIPPQREDNVLIAAWNIANLGLHDRDDRDYQLLAEVISWFDIVAIQEVNDDLSGLRNIQKHLNHYAVLFSDKGGNDERAAFIYDVNRVFQLDMVGEVSIPPAEHRYIRLPGVADAFRGFDRNPYLASFSAGSFEFVLVNVHLFFGSDDADDVARRSLEAYATSRWADLRSDDRHTYVRDIIPLGDFNLPKVAPGDPIYEALKRRGLWRPPHSTRIASTIASDSDYDQIFFLPGETRSEFTGRIGVFDFDGAVYADVYQQRTMAQFRSFVRYHLSDHRPVWAEFQTSRDV